MTRTKPDTGTVLVTTTITISKDQTDNLSKKKDVEAEASIPSAKDISGIEIRLLPPYIIDNRTERIWPFPGYARLYCLVIVVSDVDNQMAGNIDLKGFQRIGDREHLPINKTIFYWQQKSKTETSPTQVHVMCQ